MIFTPEIMHRRIEIEAFFKMKNLKLYEDLVNFQ